MKCFLIRAQRRRVGRHKEYSGEHMQSDEQQIRQLVSTWHAATRAGDVDTVLDLMVDDVVFLVPGRPPMRKEEFASLSRVGTPPDGGQPMERAGHTLTVLRRVNGKWLLARDANLLAPVQRSSSST
jgi:ketosteroid isomerase-like protein